MKSAVLEIISSSIEETFKIATLFKNAIEFPSLVGLTGNLGSGKTAFVKAFVRSLDEKNEIVQSPTFTLINVYNVKNIPITHIDLYRLNSPREMDQLGIEDYLAEGIAFIEWIDKYGSEFERLNYIEICFQIHDDEKRKICFKKHVGAYKSDVFERSWERVVQDVVSIKV